jgi:hypothetical protein
MHTCSRPHTSLLPPPPPLPRLLRRDGETRLDRRARIGCPDLLLQPQPLAIPSPKALLPYRKSTLNQLCIHDARHPRICGPKEERERLLLNQSCCDMWPFLTCDPKTLSNRFAVVVAAEKCRIRRINTPCETDGVVCEVTSVHSSAESPDSGLLPSSAGVCCSSRRRRRRLRAHDSLNQRRVPDCLPPSITLALPCLALIRCVGSRSLCPAWNTRPPALPFQRVMRMSNQKQ